MAGRPQRAHRSDAAALPHLLLASGERTIGEDGIHFRTFASIAPELQGHGGQRAVVRYMPYDDRSIEVYLDGADLCTALPGNRLTPPSRTSFAGTLVPRPRLWPRAAPAYRVGHRRAGPAHRCRARRIIGDLIDHLATGVVHGCAGTGKTFAV
ncbi:Mu transposase C-terminal domain-containing protein [Nonomuraea fuscirosea]|uniref:Mu transposase C-terminal domain-containing protein n=1 Tax=Nonomuraea fuscirosea TaxID=1291556 RepID=UPI001C62B237|nr:Mu transposase C-terminal domain-containing protein [Nonomuraea fuscirosea]